jgi:NADP-dependent 3-hydroxy acid dehydrogenase YdfG
MPMLFQDQVSLVTGASSGIGRAIASQLAAAGSTVRAIGRNLEALKAIAKSAGERVSFEVTDITVDKEVLELASHIQKECGRLDILVHAAGLFFRGPVAAAPVEEFDNHYKTNLRAPYVVTQALLPLLCRSRGQIVFINSTAVLTAQANVSQYAASKHGLKALADSLREEVNPDGVRVLSLFLGRTATPMQRSIHAQEGKRYWPDELIQPEDVSAAVVALLALPRSVEVMNVAMRPLKRPGQMTSGVAETVLSDPAAPAVRACQL